MSPEFLLGEKNFVEDMGARLGRILAPKKRGPRVRRVK